MNAGAYGGEMKDVVTSVKVMDADGHIYDMSSDELDFRTDTVLWRLRGS